MYYRHSKNYSNDLFNIKFESTLQKIQDDNKISITCEDPNQNFLNHKHSKYASGFIKIMHSNLFQPFIIEPTRTVARNKPSLVDNIFINTSNRILHAVNCTDKISDHLPNFLLMQNLNGQKLKAKVQVSGMKNFKMKQFIRDSEKEDLMEFSETYTVVKMYDKIQGKLLLMQ